MNERERPSAPMTRRSSALRAVVESALAKPIDRRVPVRAVELHADLGSLGARAHRARVGAVSERQPESVDENRLAGARLAGHHAEAALELELDLVDDGVVPDLDQAQHRSGARDGRIAAIRSAPVELRAQKLVVVVVARVEQRDRLVREPDAEHLAAHDAAERLAVANDLRRRVGAGVDANLDASS